MFQTLKKTLTILVLTVVIWAGPSALFAQVPDNFMIDAGSFVSKEGFSSSINLLLAMATISLIPFILISTTAFLRIIIVLSMLRQALATQQSPPNMVLISLATFLTIFVMTPTFQAVNENAIQPYKQGKITQMEAFDLGVKPFKVFMVKFIREKDLALFLEFSKVPFSTNLEEIPIYVLIPSYILSELRAAFQIGFLLFIPFLVIDLIISNILLSLGMFMLSPAIISLPFKILLFVLTDGWNLIVRGLLISIQK